MTQQAEAQKVVAAGIANILNGTATSDDVLAEVAEVMPEAVPARTRARLQSRKERLTSSPYKPSAKVETTTATTPRQRAARTKALAALTIVGPAGEVVPVVPASERRLMAPADQAPKGMRRCQGAFKIGVLPHYAPIETFTVQKSSKDGLAPYCKPCRHEDCRQGRLRWLAANGKAPQPKAPKAPKPERVVKQRAPRMPKADPAKVKAQLAGDDPNPLRKRAAKAPAPAGKVSRVKHIKVGTNGAGEVVAEVMTA